MRIAMVSMHTSPAEQPGTGDAGGLNVYVLETAKALAQNGHSIDLYTRSHGAPDSRSLHPGVMLYALEAGGGIVRKHDLPNLADDFGEQLQRAALASTHAYDIIHSHYWLSGLAALPVSLSLGIPMVQSFHTLATLKNAALADGDMAEPQRRVLTERYLAHEAAAHVAVSMTEADAIIDDLGATADDVWLVPPAVDGDAFSPVSLGVRDDVLSRLGVHDEHLVVVVGRVQPAKGQDLAIRMLPHLPHTVLAIAGEATPGQQEWADGLHTLAAELGVADRVRFIGGLAHEELSRLYGAASLVVIPSRSETFGMVALEAAACGTPVVAGRVGGLVESVADGVSGVLVDGRDPEAWADACLRLLDDSAALAMLSGTARTSVEGRTWRRAAESLEQIYGMLSR